MFITNLRRDGYTFLPASTFDVVARDAEQAFVDVLKHVPHELLLKTEVRRDNEGSNITPDGYTRRQGATKDFKRYIHFRPQWFMKDVNWELRSISREYDQFLTAAYALHEGLASTVLDIVHALDAEFPCAQFASAILERGQAPGVVIRFLAYDCVPENVSTTTLLASEHHDKSAVTCNVYESAPGLEVKDADGTYVLLPRERGHVPVMIGDLGHRLSHGVLRKVWHRVRALPNTTPRDAEANIARTSIILFIDKKPGAPIRTPSWKETHTE